MRRYFSVSLLLVAIVGLTASPATPMRQPAEYLISRPIGAVGIRIDHQPAVVSRVRHLFEALEYSLPRLSDVERELKFGPVVRTIDSPRCPFIWKLFWHHDWVVANACNPEVDPDEAVGFRATPYWRMFGGVESFQGLDSIESIFLYGKWRVHPVDKQALENLDQASRDRYENFGTVMESARVIRGARLSDVEKLLHLGRSVHDEPTTYSDPVWWFVHTHQGLVISLGTNGNRGINSDYETRGFPFNGMWRCYPDELSD